MFFFYSYSERRQPMLGKADPLARYTWKVEIVDKQMGQIHLWLRVWSHHCRCVPLAFLTPFNFAE